MVRTVVKCSECRRKKQKCIFLTRPEPDRGIQDTCEGCKRGDRQCGAPERVKRGRLDRVQQAQRASNMAAMGQDPVETHGEEGEDIDSIAADEMRRSKQCPDDLLRDLDYTNETIKLLVLTIESLIAQQRPSDLGDAYGLLARCNSLSEILNVIKLDLHTKLGIIQEKADEFIRKGDMITADRVYSRLLQGHSSSTFSLTPDFLLKIANYYFEREEHIQEERCLKQILDLPVISDQIRDETFQKMVRSMKISSEKINQIFLSHATGNDLNNVQFPFPVLHRMMRLGHMPMAPADLHKLGLVVGADITGSPPLHSAIASGLPIAIDMIRNCVDSELERRDSYDRTPLFLSALCQNEVAGKELLNRFARLNPELRKLRMNDRDFFGRTILAVAILTDCAFDFICLLIEKGADVNPYLYPYCATPLQAAARNGRQDVVLYLLQKGATVDHVAPDDLTAMQLAASQGHYDIVAALEAHCASNSTSK